MVCNALAVDPEVRGRLAWHRPFSRRWSRELEAVQPVHPLQLRRSRPCRAPLPVTAILLLSTCCSSGPRR